MDDNSRLKVQLGRLTLSNPLICGSGEPVMTEAGIRAALNAGVAGVVAKSVNEQAAAAQQLDHADYCWIDPYGKAAGKPDRLGSLFCRSGLSKRGYEEWFRAVAAIDRDAGKQGQFVAASIVLGSAEGALELARLARRVGIRLFEFNVGAPHALEAQAGVIENRTDPADLRDLVRQVRTAVGDMVLWVKLTGLTTNIPALAQAAVEGGADAVIAMGRFLAMVPSLDDFSPTLGSSAAYGGSWAVPIVCRYLALCRQAIGHNTPLLGTNGIRSGADLLKMMLSGAWATEVLTVVMMEGFEALTRIRKEMLEFLQSRDTSAEALIGKAADSLRRYSEQPELAGRWQSFVPAETLK
jgi:dihydroorotate dehydrogenase